MTFLITYFWTCILLLYLFLDVCLKSVSCSDKIKFMLISFDIVLDITNKIVYEKI